MFLEKNLFCKKKLSPVVPKSLMPKRPRIEVTIHNNNTRVRHNNDAFALSATLPTDDTIAPKC